MNYTLRKITAEDRELFLSFIGMFHNSPAMLHPVDKQVDINNFEELMRSDEYLECYFINLDGKDVGYVLLSKSFSSEVGGKIVWVEEIMLLDEYRSMGIGSDVLKRVEKLCPYTRLRLEVEPDNERAKKLYYSLGFEELPYMQMIIDKK